MAATLTYRGAALPRSVRALLTRLGETKLSHPPRQPPLTARHWKWLPKQIMVLDIEGSGRSPDKSELFIVGTLPYSRSGCRYIPGHFRVFTPSDLSALEQLLSAFDGPLLGHNVFDYDYRVLGRHILVGNLISRTIDLRAALEKVDRDSVKHLNLQMLASWNFGKSKLRKSADIPVLWRKGKKSLVIRYNRRDLELTAELWFALVTRRIVLLVDRFQMSSRDQIAWFRMPYTVWRLLAGRDSTLTEQVWLANIAQYKHALGVRPTRTDKYFIEEASEAEEKRFHRLSCGSCYRQSVLVVARKRIFSDDETWPCPFCGLPIALESSGLLTYFGISLAFVHLGTNAHDLRQDSYPPEKTARRWIRNMRWWRY